MFLLLFMGVKIFSKDVVACHDTERRKKEVILCPSGLRQSELLLSGCVRQPSSVNFHIVIFLSETSGPN